MQDFQLIFFCREGQNSGVVLVCNKTESESRRLAMLDGICLRGRFLVISRISEEDANMALAEERDR